MISESQFERMRNEIHDALFMAERIINDMDNNSIIIPFEENDNIDYRKIVEDNVTCLKNYKEAKDIEEFREDVAAIAKISAELFHIRMIIAKHYYV